MSKSQISSHLADKFGFTKKTGAGVLEEIAQLAYKEARKGFTLPGIGKLVVVKRKARKGRNPQTGEEISIKASKSVRFRPGKAFKEYL